MRQRGSAARSSTSCQDASDPAHVASLAALPTSLLTFVTTPLLTMPRFLRGRRASLPSLHLRRASLPSLRRGRGPSLHTLRLILLPNYGVARLIAVVLAMKHLLLLRLRISIP